MAKKDPYESEYLLKFCEVSKKVSLSRATIYSLIRQGKFPAPFKPTPHCSRWTRSSVAQWIETLARMGEV